jgi:hypothetical protein
MKQFLSWQLAALAGTLACMAPLVSLADDYDKKTIVTISQPTEVPGIVLEPGTYVIKLLNSSSNRHIAEIMNERMDHLYALTFTVAAEKVTQSGKTVLTFYEGSNGRPPALRKWFWPGDLIGQEFVYPKNQAERISAASKERVPAGNLPTLAESGQSLTPDNAKGLSSEISERSEISAKKDKADDDVEDRAEAARKSEVGERTKTLTTVGAAESEKAPQPTPVVIAQNTPPPIKDQVRQSDSAASSRTSGPQNQTLPQTASNLPLVALIGGISLVLAVAIRFVSRSVRA